MSQKYSPGILLLVIRKIKQNLSRGIDIQAEILNDHISNWTAEHYQCIISLDPIIVASILL
jgi:hypothetical protein